MIYWNKIVWKKNTPIFNFVAYFFLRFLRSWPGSRPWARFGAGFRAGSWSRKWIKKLDKSVQNILFNLPWLWFFPSRSRPIAGSGPITRAGPISSTSWSRPGSGATSSSSWAGSWSSSIPWSGTAIPVRRGRHVYGVEWGRVWCVTFLKYFAWHRW